MKIVVIGFGCVGQGLLPLLLRDLPCSASDIVIVCDNDIAKPIAQFYSVNWLLCRLSPTNFDSVLAGLVQTGDVVLNLAVEVCSADVLAWCQHAGVLYIDTGIEPWPGAYEQVFDPNARKLSTNYWMRHAALQAGVYKGTTAILAHGANPGLVSHFVKAALFELATIKGMVVDPIAVNWAQLACDLKVQTIQIAERDTQDDACAVPVGEFVGTWSVDGFLAEARQAPELGWGSHENDLLPGMQTHEIGCQAAVVWWPNSANAPLRRVKSWTPAGKQSLAWLITHNEAISLAEFLTIKDASSVTYRPTVYYAYSPCRPTQVSLQQWQADGFREPSKRRIIGPDVIREGHDELGVLLCFPGGAYWYGSTLSAEQARRIAPHNSATSLQVAAGVLGALKWAMRHPNSGVLEAEQLDSMRVLRYARPYLGALGGELTDWQPGSSQSLQFVEFLEDSVGEEASSIQQ